MAGVADQVLSSGTNFATAYVASLLLDVTTFSTFVIAFSIVLFALGIQRAVVGFPLLSHASTFDEPQRRRMVDDALASAFVLGVVGAALGLLVWASGVELVHDLVWLAPWLPAVLVQDAARYALLCASRPGGALLLDAVWVVVQAAVMAVAVSTGNVGVGTLSAAWGLGALAGAITFLVGFRAAPWRGRCLRWLRESRHVSGWGTPTMILSQTQQNGVLVLVGAVLAAEAAGGLRAIQLLVLQPVQTLLSAVMVLLVPPIARLRASNDHARLRRTARRLSRLFTAAGLLVLVVVPLRDPLLALLFPKFVDYGSLVLPMAVQVVLTTAALPSQATLRGLNQVRDLFLVQMASVLCAVAGVFVGAALGGVLGVAWALAGATAVLLVASRLTSRRAVRAARERHEAENNAETGARASCG